MITIKNLLIKANLIFFRTVTIILKDKVIIGLWGVSLDGKYN